MKTIKRRSTTKKRQSFRDRIRKCTKQKIDAIGGNDVISDEFLDQAVDGIMRVFSGEFEFKESDIREMVRMTNKLYPKGKVLSQRAQIKAQAEEEKSPLVTRLTKRTWGYTPDEIQEALKNDTTDKLSFAKIEKFGRRCVNAFDVQAKDAPSLSLALGKAR